VLRRRDRDDGDVLPHLDDGERLLVLERLGVALLARLAVQGEEAGNLMMLPVDRNR
jgi:hypothetical protein